METDLNRIKKLSEEKEDENWKFRSFLKVCNISSKKNGFNSSQIVSPCSFKN